MSSSASSSMRPLPQRPWGGASSMVRNVGSSVAASIQMSSIAPLVARMPLLTPPPFEGGAGGAGTGDQPLPVAEHDLAVGADVHEQRQLLRGVQPGRDDAGGDVAAHPAAYGRHETDAGARVQLEAKLAGQQRGRAGERGYVGLLAKVPRIDAEQEVGHHGVAGGHHLVEVDGRTAVRASSSSMSSLIVSTTSCCRRARPWPALRVHDARDDIVAAGDLRVVGGGAVDHPPRAELHQVDDDARRPHVHGQAVLAVTRSRRVCGEHPGRERDAAVAIRRVYASRTRSSRPARRS